jgi:serine/threonine protein kinase
MIGIGLIERIKVIHSKHFVHRDMKPENVLIGQGKKDKIIHMIDYGLSKRYISPNTGKHIPISQKAGCIGTLRYISLNAHLGFEHSRRDDLESIGNILIYFLCKGKLPWSDFQHPDNEVGPNGKLKEYGDIEY